MRCQADVTVLFALRFFFNMLWCSRAPRSRSWAPQPQTTDDESWLSSSVLNYRSKRGLLHIFVKLFLKKKKETLCCRYDFWVVHVSRSLAREAQFLLTQGHTVGAVGALERALLGV